MPKRTNATRKAATKGPASKTRFADVIAAKTFVCLRMEVVDKVLAAAHAIENALERCGAADKGQKETRPGRRPGLGLIPCAAFKHAKATPKKKAGRQTARPTKTSSK